jgi:hypothetical protein
MQGITSAGDLQINKSLYMKNVTYLYILQGPAPYKIHLNQ